MQRFTSSPSQCRLFFRQLSFIILRRLQKNHTCSKATVFCFFGFFWCTCKMVFRKASPISYTQPSAQFHETGKQECSFYRIFSVSGKWKKSNRRLYPDLRVYFLPRKERERSCTGYVCNKCCINMKLCATNRWNYPETETKRASFGETCIPTKKRLKNRFFLLKIWLYSQLKM